MAGRQESAKPSIPSRKPLGDDPLSTNESTVTPPSTTPHLPKIEDIFRASVEHIRHPVTGDAHHNDHDLEAMSLISESSNDRDNDIQQSREIRREDEDENGFEAPTKTEKTLMITSISVVLLFSVAAGLTTVCDWVL